VEESIGSNSLQCDRCKTIIARGEEVIYQGQTLCEVCYMDALSPPRMCDPWAAYQAKSLSEDSGTGNALTDKQKKIVELLDETGGIAFTSLVDRLNINPSDLERELATLRHMERIKARLEDGEKLDELW
jgi:hypothetical protein